jgi:hypothetical protein
MQIFYFPSLQKERIGNLFSNTLFLKKI